MEATGAVTEAVTAAKDATEPATPWHIAFAALGAALGIGLLGMKAAEATGRNPGAATPILTLGIILAALIEGVFIITALVVGK